MRRPLLLVLYRLSSFLAFKKLELAVEVRQLASSLREQTWGRLVGTHQCAFPLTVCVCRYCIYVPSALCVYLHVLPGWKVFCVQAFKVSYCCSQQPTSYSQANGIKRRHMVTEESGDVGTRMQTCALFVYLEGHITIYPDVCKASVGHLICERQPLKLCVCSCLFYTRVCASVDALQPLLLRFSLLLKSWIKVICQFERPSCLLLSSAFYGCALTTNTVLGVCW